MTDIMWINVGAGREIVIDWQDFNSSPRDHHIQTLTLAHRLHHSPPAPLHGSPYSCES